MITPTQGRRFYHASREWFGDGKAVPHEVAEQRAATCLTCSKHVEKPWQEIITGRAAGYVRHQLELKHHLDLHVTREAELHTCDMCQCWLPLKTWLPIERARKITPDWPQFPSNCWLHQNV